MSKVSLIAPDGYYKLTPEEKASICNGAGAKGGIKVPNTMYGLDLTEAFNIHDYGYYVGATNADKRNEDRRMLSNCLIIINSAKGWFNRMLAPLRRRRALKYYEAVYYLGKKAFLAEKNKHG